MDITMSVFTHRKEILLDKYAFLPFCFNSLIPFIHSNSDSDSTPLSSREEREQLDWTGV